MVLLARDALHQALTTNKLKSLPPGVFDHLTKLTYLGLGENQLQSLK